jgi:HlyD family secretion protein
MMIRPTLGAIALAATTLFGVALPWGERGVGVPTAGAGVYLTAEVATGRIRRTVSATGTLEAVTTVEVSSQLSGQISRLDADFNDQVRVGQALVTLDQRGFEARVAQAESEARMARENVAILSAKLDQARGLEDEAGAQRKVFGTRIDLARVELDAAQRQFTRADKLAGRGAASIASVEDARSARDAAAAKLREAEALAIAHENTVASRQAGRREAEAELANAEAALPLRDAALVLARLDLERSTIRAPIDGVVVGRNVEPGQTVAASLNAPVLFTIAGDLAKMEVHANIDETDIGAIAVGQAAEFTVDAFPGQTFPARVSEIRKAAQLIQGVVTYTVVLQTENPDGLLLPGMTSIVRIAIEETGAVRTVPLAALRFTGEGAVSEAGKGKTLWVLEGDGKIEPRNVAFGLDDGSDVAVLDGDLAVGERVVIGRVPHPGGRRIFGIRF